MSVHHTGYSCVSCLKVSEDEAEEEAEDGGGEAGEGGGGGSSGRVGSGEWGYGIVAIGGGIGPALASMIGGWERRVQAAAYWSEQGAAGAQFTCFVSTKVQTMTEKEVQMHLPGNRWGRGSQVRRV